MLTTSAAVTMPPRPATWVFGDVLVPIFADLRVLALE
jgi:hypothetical protein